MLFITFYLWINAAIYGIFAVWCTVKPESTAAYLGYGFTEASGKIEYLTVYGGLELGLALFFAYSVLVSGMAAPAVYFSFFLYLGIVLFRTGSLLWLGWSGMPIFIIAVLEYVLLAGAMYSLHLIRNMPGDL